MRLPLDERMEVEGLCHGASEPAWAWEKENEPQRSQRAQREEREEREERADSRTDGRKTSAKVEYPIREVRRSHEATPGSPSVCSVISVVDPLLPFASAFPACTVGGVS